MDVADLGAVKSCDLAGERVRYLDGQPEESSNATPNLSLPTKNCLNKPSRSLADVLNRIKKEDIAQDQELIAHGRGS
jgi:hypothetical protein